MAILRVEREDSTPDRVLIRVRTVDDVVEESDGDERAFSAASPALEHLREWLDALTG
jgi:hypothetical protein